MEELNSKNIAEKMEALKANMSKKIEEKKQPKTSKKVLFLREIGSVIKEKYDDGISYKDMSKSIFEIFNIKVNEQTIRAFAHAELGIPKKAKKIAPSSAEPVKNEVFFEEATTPVPVAEAPKKLGVKDQRRLDAENAKKGKE